MTISLCMIIKNEEKVLDNCLNSFKDVVDEIIIVDTGSVDNSIEIAKKYTNKIYDFKWCDDFAKARNYSLSFAISDYIMWVDADDYLIEEEKEKLLKLKQSIDGSVDMYYLLYDFDENYLPFYRERIFKNKKYEFKGKIHEAIVPHGNLKYEDIKINQYDKKKGLTDRNLKIFQSMKKEEFTCRDYYYYAKELYRHSKFDKAKQLFIEFIDMNGGYYVDKIDACYYLSMIYNHETNYKKSLEILFHSFVYDLPKANVLTEIGNIYLAKNEINCAIYYYKLALNCKYDNKFFIHKDYLYFIPLIQLCVCYAKLNDYNKAYEYNELANKYKKDNPYYLNNKHYLKQYCSS